MTIGIYGTKIGMTQIYNEDGEAIPVTVVEASPCTILQVKTQETDGYSAIQLGIGEKREDLLTKAIKGKLKDTDRKTCRYIRELRIADSEIGNYKVGDEVKIDTFEEGEFVDVTGISKGKGFQGVVKRHNFKGAKEMSHGAHESKRHSGSIGASAWPGRVFKGKKMPGRMGTEKVTVQHLKIVKVDNDKNLLLISGSVPGVNRGLVKVRKSVKKNSVA